MRVVKRVTATLIAVVIALSASTIGFADETEKNCDLLIKENARAYYICVFCDAKPESFKRIDIFKQDENGERTLLKMISIDEDHFNYKDVRNGEGFIIVVIDDKEFFEYNGNYAIEFYPHDVTPEGCEKAEKISIGFNFAESIEPEYEIIEIYTTLQVGREIDITALGALPEGYKGKYFLDYEYNHLGDDDNRKMLSARDGKIKALREGDATVKVKDSLSGKTLCTIDIDLEPKQAENFFELIKFTFQAMGNGASGALKSTGNILLGFAWGLAMPVAVMLTAIGSLIFI